MSQNIGYCITAQGIATVNTIASASANFFMVSRFKFAFWSRSILVPHFRSHLGCRRSLQQTLSSSVIFKPTSRMANSKYARSPSAGPDPS